MVWYEYGIRTLGVFVDDLLQNAPLTLATILALVLVYAVNWLVFVPFEINQDRNEPGTVKATRSTAAGAKSRRRPKINVAGTNSPKYPPPFPNGWYGIAKSEEIGVEEVKSFDFLGSRVAVFRTASGSVYVLDAYCPHLGADVGIGGTVRGNCVECPFHHWSFQGTDGQCVNIAYSSSDQIPKSARLKKWQSIEQNGYIFAWYHAENETPWSLPSVPEIESGEWVYHGGNTLYVNCHIQDIPENGADVAHLDAVHGTNLLSGSSVGHPKYLVALFGSHVWKGEWRHATEKDRKHCAVSELHHSVRFLNKFETFRVSVIADQVGPAFVQLNLDTPVGKVVILQTVTPIEPLLQKVVHRFYAPRLLFLPSKIFVIAETVMIKRDILMWNNKHYIDSPCLVKGDRFIKNFRLWYKQFYSANSVTYKEAIDGLDW